MKLKILFSFIATVCITLFCCGNVSNAAPEPSNQHAVPSNESKVDSVPTKHVKADASAPKADTALVIAKNDEIIGNSPLLVAQNGEINGDAPLVIAKNDEINAPPPEVAQHRINSHDPLSNEQQKILDSIVWDADPEVLNAVIPKNEGRHFLYSDELHPEKFMNSIKNLGGTYIGIGTDQGYMFIGWQRPTLAFLIDYDPWVILLHRIYFYLFKTCNDGECIIKFFENKAAALDFFNSPEAKEAGISPNIANVVYKAGAKIIAKELKNARRMREKNFMNDPEIFQYIKEMIIQGRIRTFQANLLGDRAFDSISKALNQLGASVTTLYLSNAETYWNYTKQFRTNILSLPVAENALIMRTIATKIVNKDYRYSVQPYKVFKAWLEYPKCHNVWKHTQKVEFKDSTDIPFSIDTAMPPSSDNSEKK